MLNKQIEAKLCDFGSAKVLVPGQKNISYICSRYYRAPELIFGATEYTSKVDVWSCGCVIGEMLIKKPLFEGSSNTSQMLKIIKILGPPTEEDLDGMDVEKQQITKLEGIGLKNRIKKLNHNADDRVIDLLERMLKYNPKARYSAGDCLKLKMFQEFQNGKE